MIFLYSGEVEEDYEASKEESKVERNKSNQMIRNIKSRDDESDKSETFDINQDMEDSNITNQFEGSVPSAAPIEESTNPNKSKKFTINAPAAVPNRAINDEWSEDIIDSDEEKTVPLVRGLTTKRS